MVHKAVRIPSGARDPEEGFSDEKEERERENKLRSLSTFRLRRSPSLITGLCGDTDAYGQLVSPLDSLLGKSVPVSRTILFTIRGIFKEDEREREDRWEKTEEETRRILLSKAERRKSDVARNDVSQRVYQAWSKVDGQRRG